MYIAVPAQPTCCESPTAKVSANSIAALTADWRVFVRWCHGPEADCGTAGNDSPAPFPVSQDTLDAFVRSMGETRKASTIRRYLASIAALHTGSGLPNPCTTPRIKQAVKVVAARQARANQKAREDNQPAPMPPRQAAGLREDHLDALEAEPAQLSLRDPRARALLWTAHDTLLRASELRQVTLAGFFGRVRRQQGCVCTMDENRSARRRHLSIYLGRNLGASASVARPFGGRYEKRPAV